jgi:hypothetical protein
MLKTVAITSGGGGGNGTVTQVGGTGTVNGITLTGNVTTTGNLTLGGTLGSIANSQLTNSAVTIGNTSVSLGGTTSSLGNLALDNVTVGATTANTGVFTTLTSTGTAYLGGVSGNQSLQVNNLANAVNYVQVVGAVTNSNPIISALGTDTDIGLNFDVKGVGTHKFRSLNGSAVQFSIDSTTNSVNYLTVTGGVAGGYPPIFRNTGSDANIGMVFATKGTGNILLTTNYLTQAQVSSTASAVNYLNFTGAATNGGTLTNTAPTISAAGSDANINIRITPKGTGTLQFGTYTAGVLSQAGYITITDAGGTSRRLLVG